MLVLLFAFQLSTTNCIPDANGGMHCTTVTPQPPQLPPLPQAPPIPESSRGSCALCNLISIFESNANKRHAKAVGNMLAKGDCAGAERYALQKGEFDLADRIKAYCAEVASSDPTPTRSANWLHVGTTSDGTSYYSDAKSLRREGKFFSVWEIVVRPSSDAIRETRALNIYDCPGRASAVKMIVNYRRDGKIHSEKRDERDLNFIPVVPNTIGNASFLAVCAQRSTSTKPN